MVGNRFNINIQVLWTLKVSAEIMPDCFKCKNSSLVSRPAPYLDSGVEKEAEYGDIFSKTRTPVWFEDIFYR